MLVLLARWWVLALVVVGLVAGCGAPTGSPGAPASAPPPDAAASVLESWDSARSAAWAAGDPVRLAALYLPAADAGLRDVQLLRTYLARGLRMSGLRFQRLGLRVLTQDDALLRLDVVERLLPASVRRGGVVRRLPGGQPVRRLIELRRVEGFWRVAAVVRR